MAKVLYISQGYSPHDRRFMERLSESGHTVWFLPCARNKTRYEMRPLPAGVTALPSLREGRSHGPFVDAFFAVPRLRGHLAKIRPDLVHAGPIQSGAFFAALAGCRPLIAMSWGSDILVMPDRSRSLAWITRFTLDRAHRVLADCRAVSDRMTALSGLSPERVVAFPYGVDLDRFNGQVPFLGLREKMGWSGCRILISARSLEQSHGALVLLEALRRILPQQPDLRVLMLGDGSLRSRIEEDLRTSGLKDRVHLAGQVQEDLLPAYFQEADLYVSASFSDGTSVTLLEAMASGLPVITTDEPGNREWVAPGVNGWLTPAGDASRLAATIADALKLEKDARLRMAEQNRRRVREGADWRRNFSRLTEAYGELMHASV